MGGILIPMTALRRDIRTGIHTLLRRPGATVVAILTLALGIGANTAIFSLLNAVVFRSLPVPHPEQLAALATTIADNVNGDEPFTLQMFDELSRQHQLFSHLFAWNGGGIDNFEAEGKHYAAGLASVSGGYYKAMQIAPVVGRFISPGDVALNSGTSDRVAVISYRGWRGWYHGASNILGKTIRVENQPFTIIGVEPEGYSGLIIDGTSDVTVPLFAPGLNLTEGSRDPRRLWLRLYARLRPGFTIKQTRTMLETVWPHVLEATRPPGYEGARRTRFFARRITVESAATGVSYLRKRFSYSLRVLLALVGAVLLIACLNLANLSLARAAGRQHESGIRSALGASTWDLVRQPLAESLLLSFTGALLGLVFAYWTSQALLHVAWTGLVITPLSTSPDLKVLAFTAAVAAATGPLFALARAWYAAQTDPMEALKNQTRSVRGGATWLGKSLLVTQIALSLILVVGALLFERTLTRLHTVDVGYRRDHLLTILLFPQPGIGNLPNSAAYYRELTEQLQRLPGVERVSFSAMGPANEFEYLDGVYRSLVQAPVQAVDETVAPDFFKVAGMRLIRGREFKWQDDAQNPNLAIISQSLAERLFGHEDAMGQTIYTGPRSYARRLKIVGIVNSASLWKVESLHPLAIYQPMSAKFVDIEPLVDIRTTVDPRIVKAAAERVVRGLRHHYPLRTMTVDERLDSYLTVQRLTAMLAAFFGVVGLLIAAIGLYGLMSFHVTRRTAELGIV
ncbi:MAG: ABC transporter permease [Acidobacteriota bacterium]|nr:ABC transporter permease [Acidobacteriota bacterium]